MSPAENRLPAAGDAAWHLPAPLLTAAGGMTLFGMAVWLWIGAAQIDGAGSGVTGPDGFPRAIAILLGASSLVMVGQAFRAAIGGTQTEMVEIRRPAPVLAALVLVAVYPFLLDRLHYYVATTIWLAPLLWLTGMRKPLWIVVTTAAFLLFTKVLFEMALGVPMP